MPKMSYSSESRPSMAFGTLRTIDIVSQPRQGAGASRVRAYRSIFSLCTCVTWVARPLALFIFLLQKSHRKCLAF